MSASPGSRLSSRASPDATNASLELEATGPPQRHQVFELPQKLAHCTEHQLSACRCSACGQLTRAGLEPQGREGFEPGGWWPCWGA